MKINPEKNNNENSSSAQVNTINLLKGNIIAQDKLKSNYCQKITMSNLEKYYEYCVKKVQNKMISSQEVSFFEKKYEEN